MDKIGREITATDHWQKWGGHYMENINSPYHVDRLRAICSILPDLTGKTVLDLGCGEGILIRESLKRGAAKVVGLDIDDEMVKKSVEQTPQVHIAKGDYRKLREHGPADCILAANVCGYFTSDEDIEFYKVAHATLKPGGQLVIMHSNRAFDYGTFNAYTVDSVKEELGFDPSPLIVHSRFPNRFSFNVRENPFVYRHKLEMKGFRQEAIVFANYHPEPPIISGKKPDDLYWERKDVSREPPERHWHLALKCSMFGVRAVRV